MILKRVFLFRNRSCWVLAQTYAQLPRDLFNAAFVSCWTELSKPLQQELLGSIEKALMVPDLPELTQVWQTLLIIYLSHTQVTEGGFLFVDYFEFS